MPDARIPEPFRPAGLDGSSRSGAASSEVPGTADGQNDGARALVRVTVNLTPRAVDALEQTCIRTKDSKTDSINRALVVYNLVLELIERGGGHLTFQSRDGQLERVHLL